MAFELVSTKLAESLPHVVSPHNRDRLAAIRLGALSGGRVSALVFTGTVVDDSGRVVQRFVGKFDLSHKIESEGTLMKSYAEHLAVGDQAVTILPTTPFSVSLDRDVEFARQSTKSLGILAMELAGKQPHASVGVPATTHLSLSLH